jgi:hypothetical protein
MYVLMIDLIYLFMRFSSGNNAYILLLIPLMLLNFTADLIRSFVAR